MFFFLLLLLFNRQRVEEIQEMVDSLNEKVTVFWFVNKNHFLPVEVNDTFYRLNLYRILAHLFTMERFFICAPSLPPAQSDLLYAKTVYNSVLRSNKCMSVST